MSDAIVRTLSRLCVTHKNLLEWMTAAQAKYAVDLKLQKHVQENAPRARCWRWERSPSSITCGPRRGAAREPAVRDFVDRGAGSRAVDQPDAAPYRSQAGDGQRRKSAADDFPPHLAVFRDVRYGRRSAGCLRIIFRKLPSRLWPIAPRRLISGLYLLSTVASRDLGWLGHARGHRPAGSHHRHHRTARTIPGALLQLVRNEQSAAVAAHLRVLGGQRKIWPAIFWRWK